MFCDERSAPCRYGMGYWYRTGNGTSLKPQDRHRFYKTPKMERACSSEPLPRFPAVRAPLRKAQSGSVIGRMGNRRGLHGRRVSRMGILQCGGH